MGYQGHKGDTNQKDIKRGTVFILENVHNLTFIIKDDTIRQKKTDSAYSW